MKSYPCTHGQTIQCSICGFDYSVKTMPETSQYRKFFFYREISTDPWSPQVQWGWVEGNIEDHGHGPENVFAGLDYIVDKTPNPGQYMIIVQDVYDSHGTPPTTTWYVDVERIPEKRRITRRSTAEMEFGYR